MAKKSRLSGADVQQAIQKAVAEAEQKRDEPDYIGNRPAFILCQYLQGLDLPEDIMFADLKPYVMQWYDLCGGWLEDEYGEPMTFTEAWAKFVTVWPKVKHAKGQKLELAKERAKRHAEPLPELAEYDEAHQYLGMVCWELQQIAEDEPFFLSGYDAGKILGKSQPVGREALIMFVVEGILELAKVGNRKFASDYRYIGKPTGKRLSKLMTAEQFEQKKKDMLAKLNASQKSKD